MLQVAEYEQIYKATCENLSRLRYSQNILIDEDFYSLDSNESEG